MSQGHDDGRTGTQPCDTGGYQTGVSPMPTGTSHEVVREELRGLTYLHTDRADASVVTPDRGSGKPVLCVWGDSESGTPHGRGVRGGKEMEVGRYLVGSGVLCGGGGARERGGGGHVFSRIVSGSAWPRG